MVKLLRALLIILLLSSSTYCYAQSDKVDIESLKISHRTTVVTVETSATPLPAIPLAGRKVVLIQNITGTTVYVGNADVTADESLTGGYQLISDGDNVSCDFTEDIIVYGRVATSTQTVLVWEAR